MAPTRGAGNTGAMKSILVVDDEFDVRAILELILGMHNYDVVTTPSALLALEKLAQERPALILTDRMMPIMDGLEFCRRVRANPAWRDVPIIMMSAANEPDDVEPGLWDRFLHKPLDMDVLLEAVQDAVKD